MEQPYKGRATILDNYPDLQIIIPAKRNWFVIIFLGFWLCGWLFGELFVSFTVFGVFKGNPISLFMLIWLIGWTVGGFFAFRILLWNLTGKEIITVGQGVLKIDKRGVLIFKAKTYDLNEVKKIRVQDENIGFGPFGRRNDFGYMGGGTIRFDYGLRSVKFASSIDEAEARSIIEKLKERHLLTEKNYS
jgi:hypothetical protein